MGEIAENMIDGTCCSLCGQYFQHPKESKDRGAIGTYTHGYPVACKDCWEPDCGYQKAEAETF